MDDIFYNNARSARNEKAQKRTGKLSKDSIDASGWEEPTMETERKTGGRPIPRAFKRGGQVKAEGLARMKHAGRKPRASGGKVHGKDCSCKMCSGGMAKADGGKTDSPFIEAMKGEGKFASNPPESNSTPKYNAHAVQNAINSSRQKIGGKEAKMIHSLLKGRTGRADGGSANYTGGTRPTGDRVAKASGGKLRNYINKAFENGSEAREKASKAKLSFNKASARNERGESTGTRVDNRTGKLKEEYQFNKKIADKRSSGQELAAAKLNGTAKVPATREGHKKGGKVKGKTHIHININAAPKPDAMPMIPPGSVPPAAMMPKPMLPPTGMPPGGPPMGAGPMPPMAGGLPPGLGVPPPAMGAGPMPRASGGRASYKDMKSGAGSGLGRLEKTEIQKRN